MDVGYSQGMCDLLAPLLVVIDDEPLAYACFLCLMETAQELFPPSKGMNTRLANVQALLQVGLEASHSLISYHSEPLGMPNAGLATWVDLS